MQPQLCSRCKKNIAVVFITRQENGQNVNEGLCLKCAKNLGLPQVDEMMRRMGITDEDLDNISNEMMGAFGGVENLEGLTDADDPDADNEDEDGKTATFPFLSRFFGGNPAANDAQNGNEAEQTQSPRSNKKVEKGSKHKFLDSYCINLSQRARDGKLDAVVGREEAERLSALYPDMPHYPAADPSQVKLAAGWLIDRAGLKGHSEGRVGIHPRQALVIINLGGATGTEIVAFARKVQEQVKKRFGVEIEPEVNIL